jgi:hypothetical protein
MNTPADVLLALRRLRIVGWIGRAWHRMGWRHVLLALVLQVGRDVFGPLGGVFLLPSQMMTWDPVAKYLDGSWMVGGLSIVFCVLVADEAFDDGVPPLRAYGSSVLAFSTLAPALDWFFSGHFGWYRLEPLSILWWFQVLLFQGGLGVSIYAYWRVTQRTMQRTRAVETERARNQQRVQSAKLLALQSRVEPQMLFDTLGRVANLHVKEPLAADALLEGLIAFLRNLQPRTAAVSSTVEREFALVEAWLRVTSSIDCEVGRVQLQMAPDACSVGIAPMLILPMVRAVLVLPHAARDQWVLSARVVGPRLVVTLEPQQSDATTNPLAGADLSSLHDRLLDLLGPSARLTASLQPPALTLEFPRLHEDVDHDRA